MSSDRKPWEQPIEYNDPAEEPEKEPEEDPDIEYLPAVPDHYPADAPNQPEYPVKSTEDMPAKEAAQKRPSWRDTEADFVSKDTEPMDYSRGPHSRGYDLGSGRGFDATEEEE